MCFTGGELPKGVTLEQLVAGLNTPGYQMTRPVVLVRGVGYGDQVAELQSIVTDAPGKPRPKPSETPVGHCHYCGAVRSSLLGHCPDCGGGRVIPTRLPPPPDPPAPRRVTRGTSSGGPR